MSNGTPTTLELELELDLRLGGLRGGAVWMKGGPESKGQYLRRVRLGAESEVNAFWDRILMRRDGDSLEAVRCQRA